MINRSHNRAWPAPCSCLPHLALALVLGCQTVATKSAPTAASKLPLCGPTWTCISIGDLDLENGEKPTLQFESDGSVSGDVGTGHFVGSYTLADVSTLKLDGILSTRKASSPEMVEIETLFLQCLDRTTAFQVTEAGIELLAGDVILLTCSAATDLGQWIPRDPDLKGPPGAMSGGDEWLRLTSGEWLKGEMISMSRGVVEFESEELDTLDIDWDDVAELYTTRPFTLLLENRESVIGPLRVRGPNIVAMVDGSQRVYARDEVQRMVPGEPSERNFWSGALDISATARSGNANQVDLTTVLSAIRRTADTRLDARFEGVYGEQDRTTVTNNQRLTMSFDRYISSRLYWTIFGTEVFADEFQNIARRIAPFSGIGYTIKDEANLESRVGLGIGYRLTEYESSLPGELEDNRTTFVQVSTDLSADLTEKVEFKLTYWAQIGIPETVDTNQNATAEIGFDLVNDFEVFVRATWSRVGNPMEDSGGITPARDDYRMDFGWRWSI